MLLERLAGCDRLVLLGDLLELRHGPLREALLAARPLLEAVGETLGSGGEVVIVPGNHDHRLLRGWLERRAVQPASAPLGLGTEVDWRDGEPLASVAALLGPARVSASYPGTWIRDDVYATHGHYADRHNTVPILERLGAGAMARIVAEPRDGAWRAEDYEATLAPMYGWIDIVAQNGGLTGRGGGSLQVRAWRSLQRPGGRRTVRGVGVAAGFPVLVAALNRAGFGPLTADVSAVELRRAALRAFEQVLARLAVRSRYVIFGHTHRAGPLPGDEPREWVTADGTALINIGSWVYERGFLGAEPRKSPYRPGFCAVIEGEGEPQLLNLFDRQQSAGA